MKIAVPFSQQLELYRQNPSTAPRFGIYEIESGEDGISVRLQAIEENPWCDNACISFPDSDANCACDEDRQHDIRHITEHYALLEVLKGCSYVLADHFCKNTQKALDNGGIRVFKYPSIIRTAENAIKNFIIGASLANTVEHVYYVS